MQHSTHPRRVLALVIAAITVGQLLVAVPSAAASAPLFVVRGRANTSAVLEVTSPTTLDLEYSRATTTGRVLGIAVENQARTRVLAVSFEAPELRMPREGDTLPPPATWATRPTLQLPPGNYHVRLIGDGSGHFSLPVIKGSSGQLAVSEPAKAATITWRQPGLSSPAAVAVRDSIPIKLPPGGAAIYAISGHTDLHTVSPYWLCLRPDPGTCADADPSLTGLGVAAFVAAQRLWWRASFQVLAGTDLEPGSYAGETTWVSAGVAARFDEVAVVVAPSR